MSDKEPWLTIEFSVGLPGDDWPAVGGLYIFAFWDSEGDRWVPRYVDHTESLAASLPTHPRWPEAVRRAATHVHVAREHDPRIRQDAKDLIIQHYQPRMNIESKM